MKAYTDIEQSRKLAEILPLESADMFCADVFDKDKETHSYNFHILSTWGCNTFEELKDKENKFLHFIPCWSLTALLDLCPTINGKQPILTRGKLTSLWYCYYEDEIDTQTYDNPIDACYEMITRLNELNLL